MVNTFNVTVMTKWSLSFLWMMSFDGWNVFGGIWRHEETTLRRKIAFGFSDKHQNVFIDGYILGVHLPFALIIAKGNHSISSSLIITSVSVENERMSIGKIQSQQSDNKKHAKLRIFNSSVYYCEIVTLKGKCW